MRGQYNHVCLNTVWYSLKCCLVKANQTKKKVLHCNKLCFIKHNLVWEEHVLAKYDYYTISTPNTHIPFFLIICKCELRKCPCFGTKQTIYRSENALENSRVCHHNLLLESLSELNMCINALKTELKHTLKINIPLSSVYVDAYNVLFNALVSAGKM